MLHFTVNFTHTERHKSKSNKTQHKHDKSKTDNLGSDIHAIP